ncbi:MAG TPA: TIGR00282 family metallophosphoesterase [Blastocatellia bacterium]|jgi:metallophosphoesterase (TIGR00282 family)|nr:TIGR00282 family metallophosphoesterase [Blastocatellia bacterium]
MRVLILGDVVGKPGRDLLRQSLPRLRDRYEAEFVVANVENAAGGAGVIRSAGQEILDAGVDVMTSGNHIYDKKEGVPYIEKEPRLLRPANYAAEAPGRGLWLGSTSSGTQVAVLNIQGRVFMPPTDCPFKTADRIITEIGNRATVIIVDHHAEATSEKVAMGRYLDGRVSVVVGTHTHVQTADEHIMARGTAYITDLGMTGPHDSVIGVQSDLVLTRFLRGVPVRFETATGDVRVSGVAVEIDERSGKAVGIKRVQVSE